MRFGRLMEPVLAKVYEEDHPGATVILKGGYDTPPIWTPNHIVYAHIDGVISSGHGGISGPDEGIWEGKTAWDDREWKGQDEYRLPDYYEAQVRTYLAATAEPFCDVTVFFRQSATFHHIRVEANPEVDSGLVTIAEKWWADHVVTHDAPPVDGSVGATRFLNYLYPKHTEEAALVATPEVDALGRSLAVVRYNIEQATATEANIKNAIKAQMGEYGSITGTGWSATWRRSKGATRTDWQLVASGFRGLLDIIRTGIGTGRRRGGGAPLHGHPAGC